MRRLPIMVVASLLAGCALQVTSVRSSWYVMDEGSGAVTYIAILNEGNSTIAATEVILNPLRDRLLSDRYHSAWQLTLDPPRQIVPGELVYFRGADFYQGNATFSACMIPVEINLRIADGTRSRLVTSQLVAGMPNHIPMQWETDCTVGGKRHGGH